MAGMDATALRLAVRRLRQRHPDVRPEVVATAAMDALAVLTADDDGATEQSPRAIEEAAELSLRDGAGGAHDDAGSELRVEPPQQREQS
jgi:hypothetical protein